MSNDTDHRQSQDPNQPQPNNPPGRDSSRQGNQPGKDQQSGKGGKQQRDSDGERDAPKR